VILPRYSSLYLREEKRTPAFGVGSRGTNNGCKLRIIVSPMLTGHVSFPASDSFKLTVTKSTFTFATMRTGITHDSPLGLRF
jgi:hypothetical protein